MRTLKLPLLLALTASTFLIVACGDDPKDSLTQQDVMCAKMLKYGGNCANGTGAASGSAGSSAVVTQTVTLTNTTTGK